VQVCCNEYLVLVGFPFHDSVFFWNGHPHDCILGRSGVVTDANAALFLWIGQMYAMPHVNPVNEESVPSFEHQPPQSRALNSLYPDLLSPSSTLH
jgi:hypothetical protein